MTTINKRTMVTLPEESKKALDILAKRTEKSVSKTAADLIEFALQIQEDFALGELADNRMDTTFKTISHSDIWE